MNLFFIPLISENDFRRRMPSGDVEVLSSVIVILLWFFLGELSLFKSNKPILFLRIEGNNRELVEEGHGEGFWDGTWIWSVGPGPGGRFISFEETQSGRRNEGISSLEELETISDDESPIDNNLYNRNARIIQTMTAKHS